MKVQCPYCDSFIDETEEKCPNCGAVNEKMKRQGNTVPKTIAELKQWYITHNLPDETVTRFFIGKDIKEARAFGIYQDPVTGNFVVYKNKDDGSRAVRYEGKDEQYAVNELYLKLKERIAEEKSKNLASRGSKKAPMKNTTRFGIVGAMLAFTIATAGIGMFIPDNGYYTYNNAQYYYLDDWYIYDGTNWVPTEAPTELSRHYSNYIDSAYNNSSYDSGSSSDYSSSYYGDSYGTYNYNFEETEYYEEWTESHSYDSDSDSDWDSDWSSSDSWDSGGGDWGSDW